MRTVLQYSPPTDQVLSQYVEAAKEREYAELHGSPDGYILIVDGSNDFVAGVTIFKSQGRFCLFEDAVSRVGLHPRVAYAAGEMIVHAICVWCNQHGKIPVCPVTVPSLKRLMEKAGFEAVPSWVMRRPLAPTAADIVEYGGDGTGWVPPRDRPVEIKERPQEEASTPGAKRQSVRGTAATQDVQDIPQEVKPRALREKRKARRRA